MLTNGNARASPLALRSELSACSVNPSLHQSATEHPFLYPQKSAPSVALMDRFDSAGNPDERIVRVGWATSQVTLCSDGRLLHCDSVSAWVICDAASKFIRLGRANMRNILRI